MIHLLLAILTSITVAQASQQNQQVGPFVRVSSILLDSDDVSKRVEGVGTLVELPANGQEPGRYFVLTVGHIATGYDLSVQALNGSELPVARQIHDLENDLTLLELGNELPTKLITPLSNVIKGDGQYFLMSPFFPSLRSSDLGDREILLGEALVPVAIDLLDMGDFFELNRMQDPSFVALAPWLQRSRWRDEATAVNAYRHPLSSSLRAKEYQPLRSYPAGFSGTPLFIAHGHITRGLPVYLLSGVLSCSNSGLQKGGSLGPGFSAVQKLVDKSLNTKGNWTSSNDKWALVSNYFVKVGKETTVFLNCGPIGNGIVIENRKDQIQTANKDQTFQELRLEGENRKKNDLKQLKSELEKIKPEMNREEMETTLRRLRDQNVRIK